ncbi:Reverse transcriptase (RNA-dependent DNA polymerase) [Fragilaria crotonensis]|nr:Reverse transcriptase (RNA-dependent DNA polymerase) [Fragilaria crotonensis]
MNEAFKELEDAGQPMYEQQKVQFLLRSIRCDDIQVQTTMGIVRDKYLADFDAACITLSRTVSSRFALSEPGKNNKRSIGATTSTKSRGGGSRGSGRSGNRGGGRGGGGQKLKVVMNGVDVSDINRNFTSDEWEKLRTCGGIAYIHQRREYLANRGGSGRFDGRGGGYGRGGGRGYADRGSYGGRGGGRYTNDNRTSDQPRAIAATAANSSTEVVEYDADVRMRRPVLRLLEVIVVEKRVLDSGPDTKTRRHLLHGYLVFKSKVIERDGMCSTNNKWILYCVYPMASKSSHDIAQALTEFIDDVGVPGTLICDFATEQTGKNTEVMKVVRRNQIRLLLAEKGRGTTQNHRAETEIREIKTKWKTRMRENQVPSRLWDYGLVYISEIQSLLARGPDQRPGIEKILGQTVDISEWLDFDFYDRVWYWDHHKTDMNNEQARIGRWLGIAHRVGSDMTYWILTRAGHVIARRRSFEADAADDDIPPDAEYGDMNQPAKRDADDIEFDSFDQYLNSEFLVNNDGETAMARVVKRARDNNGNPIGKRHPNPLLDTREYECELEDGSLMRYHANVIAENIFAQCDDEGRRHAVLAEIVDHKADKRALRTDNGYVTTKRGRRVPKKTTKVGKSYVNGKTDQLTG